MSNVSNPYRWVPSLYVMQALPFALITAVSSILYKNLGIDNIKIAFFTSLFALPWLFKPILAPTLENIFTKKTLTLFMQFLLPFLCLLLAASLSLAHFFMVSVLFFVIGACCSTTHDICSDGLYVTCLDKTAQAKLVGPRCLFYQLGRVICQGGLVFAVGYLSHYLNLIAAWQYSLIALSLLMILMASYHIVVIPYCEQNKNDFALATTFKNVYQEFLTQPNVISIILFTVFYEFPQGQLTKIVPLFLLDNPTQGGLGLDTTWVGIAFGIIGVIAMIIGITLSGRLLSRISLQDYLVPITLFAMLTNAGYLFLSYFHFHTLACVITVITIAQFGFGLSNGAYMVYLLHSFGKGKHPMSTFAIGTSLMSLGTVLAGATSGYLQSLFGYTGFFLWTLIAYLIMTLFCFKVKMP